jgi:hypothetical protein
MAENTASERTDNKMDCLIFCACVLFNNERVRTSTDEIIINTELNTNEANDADQFEVGKGLWIGDCVQKSKQNCGCACVGNAVIVLVLRCCYNGGSSDALAFLGPHIKRERASAVSSQLHGVVNIN